MNNRRLLPRKLTLPAMCTAMLVTTICSGQQNLSVSSIPQNFIEIQQIYVSSGSAKFGEYNGLNQQGMYTSGNVSLQGGEATSVPTAGGTTSWSVDARNVGLSNGSASVNVGNQGDWKLGAGYDQLTQSIRNGIRKR